ncbi:MAG: response regulator [Verrucomicrobiales bacterium]|nr:response regulator [Verrucomicrobiales bacterium]
MPKLVVISKGLAATAHELGESWVTIGRADGNTFQIAATSVSGRHCEVRLHGDELVVRDLQSTNGTFIDDRKISEGVLKPGQTLRLGEVELQLEASAPAEATGGSFTSKLLTTKTAPGASKPAEPPKPAPAKEAKPNQPETGDASAKKFQVLFVDDSMAFLETFTELCSALSNQTWEIHSAASADRALAIMQQSPIDLVVLDIGMPMVDGIQLLGIIGRRYSGVKIAVMTGKATETNRATCLSGGAELFIEKPVSPDGIKMVFNMLNDLVSWTHREGFSGTLRQVHLQELIQMECIGRHSSILEVRNQQMIGQIYIEAGVVTHAAVGTLTGERAFNRLLSLAGGEFQLKPFKAPPQRTIQGSWETLLMEAARCFDEETVVIHKTPAAVPAKPPAPNPAPAEQPAPKPPAPATEEPAAPGDDFVVVATYDANDGKWNSADEQKK